MLSWLELLYICLEWKQQGVQALVIQNISLLYCLVLYFKIGCTLDSLKIMYIFSDKCRYFLVMLINICHGEWEKAALGVTNKNKESPSYQISGSQLDRMTYTRQSGWDFATGIQFVIQANFHVGYSFWGRESDTTKIKNYWENVSLRKVCFEC